MKAVLGLLAVALTCSGCENEVLESRGSVLTVACSGDGQYHLSQKQQLCLPFSKELETSVRSVRWSGDYEDLVELVEAGKMRWDVVEVTESQFWRGVEDGLFEKLDTSSLNAGDFEERSIHEYGVGSIVWATVLAYRGGKHSDSVPSSVTDLFDTVRFPGRRGLYDDPRGNLEFALLATGIAADELYPLDVDHALAKLDEIKHLIEWYTEGTEPIANLVHGTVALSTAWSGRIFALKLAGDSPIESSWKLAALERNYWVVPRGAGNAEKRSRFIEFASRPRILAKQADQIGYGPLNKAAWEHLTIAKDQLPKESDPERVCIDARWWAENRAMVYAKWQAWRRES